MKIGIFPFFNKEIFLLIRCYIFKECILRFSVLAIFVMALSGCNSDDSSNDVVTDYNELNIQPIGEWKTNCGQSFFDELNLELWATTSFTFTQTTIKQDVVYFTNDDCSTSYDGDELLWSGFEGKYEFLRHIESSNGVMANLYQYSYSYNDIPIVAEIGFHFEFEKMSYALEEDGTYYINYLHTFNFVN